ncbi:MAG: ribosomal L7Ae/L30e/S12e/Gadd45 family protein [Atopostipes suicloacalis]|nr:ribosomal L7Ae/L30e/S12e/Gadd45 family protein [Atopostipes suicloacalis]MDN6730758.1 ribosomal L7Ae/L30e/S12e/Gadd45 family protein [Atopostipes suicloacalis]
MNNKQKQLNLLGLALAAGKLESGSESVLVAIRNQSAKLVIIANDASSNTKKQFLNKCDYYKIPSQILFSSDEISSAIGKERTVCAFTDNGFAQSFKKLL